MSTPRLAARVAGLRPTAVNAVLRDVRALQAEGRDLVSLMRGQPDTPTPAHIVEAAEQSLRRGRTGYPDNQGEPGLRRAVSERLARDHGLSYDPEREILITDGATLGLATALAVLVGAEVNAEIEHQTARDSTVGPDEPLGRRGAHVADTVGDGSDGGSTRSDAATGGSAP